MFLKLTILTYLVQFWTIKIAETATCDYTPWSIPQGVLHGEIANVKSAETCCSFCSDSAPYCNAYSYNKVSEDCLLFNHTGFAEYPNPNTVSGIVRPLGWTTQRPIVTTLTPLECPLDHSELMQFPDPYDCSKYYNCLYGQKMQRSCLDDAGMFYDYKLERCQRPESTDCYPGSIRPPTVQTTTSTTTARPTTPIPVECPPTGVVDLPYRADCSKYISCNEGYGIVKQCDGSQLFDSVTRQCMASDLASCFSPPTGVPTTTTTITPPTSTITPTPTTVGSTSVPSTTTRPKPGECPATGIADIPHPSDCSKYLSCENGYGIVKQCNGGQQFDSVTQQCTSSDQATCFQR